MIDCLEGGGLKKFGSEREVEREYEENVGMEENENMDKRNALAVTEKVESVARIRERLLSLRIMIGITYWSRGTLLGDVLKGMNLGIGDGTRKLSMRNTGKHSSLK